MSRTGVIIALLLAAVLSVAAILVLRPRGTSNTAGPLLSGLDIAGVERLEIAPGTASATSISLHDRVPGVWLMRWRDASGAERAWPASGSRVRAALRLLFDLRTDPAAGTVLDSPGDAKVILHGAKGERRVLVLASGSVAGRARVSLEGGSAGALADAGLLQVFQPAGIVAWREPSIFGTEISDASRLTVSTGKAEISTSRVGKSWAMAAPLVAPADEPVITTVLNALGASAVRSFLASPTTESEQALRSAATRIVIESTRRSESAGEATRWSIVQTVTIGGAADVGGKVVFARLDAAAQDLTTGAATNLWGPVIVTIDRDAVNSVPADPAAYVSRIALRTPVADVGGLEFTDRAGGAWVATRAPGGWRLGAASANAATASVLDAVFNTLTRERAGGTTLTEPVGFAPAARLSVRSPDGATVEECTMLTPADAAQATALCVGSSGVWRVYTGQAVTKLAEWFKAGAKPIP